MHVHMGGACADWTETVTLEEALSIMFAGMIEDPLTVLAIVIGIAMVALLVFERVER